MSDLRDRVMPISGRTCTKVRTRLSETDELGTARCGSFNEPVTMVRYIFGRNPMTVRLRAVFLGFGRLWNLGIAGTA